jgi:hypothetical protein
MIHGGTESHPTPTPTSRFPLPASRFQLPAFSFPLPASRFPNPRSLPPKGGSYESRTPDPEFPAHAAKRLLRAVRVHFPLKP